MTDAPPRRCLVPAALLIAALAGCSDNKTNPRVAPSGDDKAAEGPGAASVVAALQKGADLASCKSAIQLVESFRGVAGPRRGEAELKPLADFARFNATDLAEVSRPELTASGLDPHYLAESILLKDAARSLGVDRSPPLDQARQSFDWVCRQVYLDEHSLPPVPPWYVLQRASGIGLERAYIFLALLRQFGLDAALVGPPDAYDQPGYRATRPDGKPQYAAFWAVGVRVGGDVYLFDPWAGRPLPGPKGQGIATLRQATTDETLAAGRGPAGGDKRDWKQAELFVALPASAMAPRMVGLEKLLAEEIGVRLAADPLAMRDRFVGEARVAKPPRFWNPPDDPFTPTRLLARFLPAEQGGLDTSERSRRLQELYESRLVPWSLFPDLKLQEEGLVLAALQNQFRERATSVFKLVNEAPHDRVLRGQFNDATKQLMELRQATEASRLRLAADKDLGKAVEQWAAEAERRFAELSRARRGKDAAAVQKAEADMNEFLTRRSQPAFDLLEGVTARVAGFDATYLLALVAHEKAARVPAGSAEASSGSAWRNARDWWRRFLNAFPELRPQFAARFSHAERLLAECEQRAQPPKK